MVTGYLGKESLHFINKSSSFIFFRKIAHSYSVETSLFTSNENWTWWILFTSFTQNRFHQKNLSIWSLIFFLAEIVSDLQKLEEEEYCAKMKEVEKVEDFRREREFYGEKEMISWWKNEHFFSSIEINKRSAHQKDTFVQRLQYHLLRNVEIELKNVHLAFDDQTSKSSSSPFQFGITLNSFKLHVFSLIPISFSWNVFF